MTIQQFEALCKEAQQTALLNNGIFLAERTDGPFRIMLYGLDGFYVEVFFFNLYNKVAFFQTVDDTDALEPYLQEMNLTALMQEVLS